MSLYQFLPIHVVFDVVHLMSGNLDLWYLSKGSRSSQSVVGVVLQSDIITSPGKI